MGNPGNPVGPGHITVGNQLILLLQMAAGLVQLFRQLRRGTGFYQMDFFSLGKKPDALRQCSQWLRAPPAQ